MVRRPFFGELALEEFAVWLKRTLPGIRHERPPESEDSRLIVASDARAETVSGGCLALDRRWGWVRQFRCQLRGNGCSFSLCQRGPRPWIVNRVDGPVCGTARSRAPVRRGHREGVWLGGEQRLNSSIRGDCRRGRASLEANPKSAGHGSNHSGLRYSPQRREFTCIRFWRRPARRRGTPGGRRASR